MYAGKVQAVPIPTDFPKGGRTYTQKNGYVYYVKGSRWDSEKKRMIEDRVPIGKTDVSNPNMMYPNDKFETYFGPIDEKVSDLQQIYDSQKRKEAGRFSIVISYGSYAILKKCAEKVGMLDALQRSMPLLSQKILAVAMHAVIAEESTAQSFPSWSFDNYCGFDIPSSDTDISRIYKEIANQSDKIKIFFELYRENFHKIFPNSNEEICAFDSTNQVTESRNQSKAKRGKAKTGENLPIINTAMYVDFLTRISILYEHFDGNVLDKTQTPYSLKKAKELGFNKLFLFMDRGYYSLKTLRSIDNLKIGFGIFVPETVDIVLKLIDDYRNVLKENPKYYIMEQCIYGIQTDIDLFNNDEKYTYYAYVYYDDHRAIEERDSTYEKIRYFLEEAKKRKRYSEKMRKHFMERSIIVTKIEKDKDTGKNFTLEVDEEKVKKIFEDAGFFIILSNRQKSPNDMIKIARGKDCVEKSFMYLKSHFKLSRTGMHSDQTYEGKMFVSFIALILLQSLRWYCRSLLEVSSHETLSTLIGEMKKYKILQKKDKTWMPLYAMNKKQKSIIKCFDLTEEEFEKEISHVKIR